MGVQILDSEIDRDRFGRAAFGLGICALILFSIVWMISSLFSVWGLGILGALIGIAIAGWIINEVAPKHLLVYNAYTWALVADNPLTGKPVAFGPGWHWIYPWEKNSISRENIISLEVRTHTRDDLTIDTETSVMKVKASIQWRPDLKGLATFALQEDETTVNIGIFDPLERFISTLFSKMTGEQAREHQSIISRLAFRAYKGEDEAGEEVDSDDPLKESLEKELQRFLKDASDLEQQFGIVIIQVNVFDVDFPEEVRKAMAAQAEQEAIIKIAMKQAGVRSIKAWRELPDEQKQRHLSNARVITGNASERVLTIHGDRQGILLDADKG